jgi:hypothetical protein
MRRQNDKYRLQQLLVMLCYVLFSVAVAFPIDNWRYEPSGKLMPHHLTSVSIFMLKRDKPPEGDFKIDITDMLKGQGWTRNDATLVPSAWDIYKASYFL